MIITTLINIMIHYIPNVPSLQPTSVAPPPPQQLTLANIGNRFRISHIRRITCIQPLTLQKQTLEKTFARWRYGSLTLTSHFQLYFKSSCNFTNRRFWYLKIVIHYKKRFFRGGGEGRANPSFF